MKLTTKKYRNWELVSHRWSEWQVWLQDFWTRDKKSLQLVMTPNPEQVMLARRDESFAQALGQADILLPDGVGLVWAAGVPERLTGVETVVELLRIAEKRGLKVLLVGGFYETTADAKLRLEIDGRETMIYYIQGYQNVQQVDQNEEKRVKKLICDLRPDVMLVALGAPWQEKWLVEHKQLLADSGVRWAMAVGGSFDFLTGKIRRAPKSWQQLRLEWLWRLIQEPSRWRRQIVLPVFVWQEVIRRIKQKAA